METDTKKLIFLRFINRVNSMVDLGFVNKEKMIELLQLGCELSAEMDNERVTEKCLQIIGQALNCYFTLLLREFKSELATLATLFLNSLN